MQVCVRVQVQMHHKRAYCFFIFYSIMVKIRTGTYLAPCTMSWFGWFVKIPCRRCALHTVTVRFQPGGAANHRGEGDGLAMGEGGVPRDCPVCAGEGNITANKGST